uniref:F-box domain-containing protein n=1 Tax=Elaeophora elaphi TaxID=1147741 RepID=A0A0R3S262_9BILA
MPFIGKDWRAPGETWVWCSNTDGWEQVKLRPIQQVEEAVDATRSPVCSSLVKIKRNVSVVSLSSNDENCPRSDTDDFVSESDEWIPHCFVKTGKSKEFVGCTSMSEAFHRLDLARAVSDVRRFNYICKVVQILVQEKLQNLSATARKALLSIIKAIVLICVERDLHISIARSLVCDFGTGLEGHLYGSPQLVSKQLNMIGDLLELISERRPRTLADSDEESTTFMDLPREILSIILRKLPDHISLLEVAKAHEVLDAIVEKEEQLWASLCNFHFTPEQTAKIKKDSISWRHAFFELKKYCGLREFYADLIHLCCHCKAIFWKDHGHPCISKDTPSVRVTPQQFVDMLLFL